ILVLVVGAGSARGQVLNGSIVGNVADPAGASVGGARVRILHVETNQTRQSETNDGGVYTFSTTPVGTYDNTVTREGFQTFTARGIRVEVNSVIRVDAVLQIGAISQSVEVSAASAALQTDRSDVRSELHTHTIESVPVAGRSYQSLFFLTP